MAKARKEIDKESMYQKIMPSSVRAIAAAAEEAAAAEGAEVKKTTAPRAKKPVAAATRPAPRPAQPPEEEGVQTPPKRGSITPPPALIDSPATPPPAAPPAPAAIPTAADVQLSVVNIMERLIDVKIDNAIDKFKCCTCALCHRDITAFALNKLHPKYIVNDPELVEEAMADRESNTQVTTALVQAILKIKSNPNH